MKKCRFSPLQIMLAFLVSDLVVLFCHTRNPFMGFLSTCSSYVLFLFSLISVVVYLSDRFPSRRKP